MKFFSQQATNCKRVLAILTEGDKPKSDSRPKPRAVEVLTLKKYDEKRSYLIEVSGTA